MTVPAIEEAAEVKAPTLSTAELEQRIRARYCTPEFATFLNVANSTGSASRFADAVSMGMYASRGHPVIGFEVKRDRSDWLRELKDPAKADVIFTYCDEWYIVANRDVVKLEELPATWGLMVPHADTLKIVKRAPKLDPKPLSRGFFAALARRAIEKSVDEAMFTAEFERGRLAGKREGEAIAARSSGQNHLANELESTRKEVERLRELVKVFEQTSGVRINTYTPPAEFAKTFALALRGQEVVRWQLDRLRQGGKEVVKNVDQMIADFEKGTP